MTDNFCKNFYFEYMMKIYNKHFTKTVYHDIIILDREYIIFTVKIFGDDENEQKISKT